MAVSGKDGDQWQNGEWQEGDHWQNGGQWQSGWSRGYRDGWHNDGWSQDLSHDNAEPVSELEVRING